jgi:translocation and assembly module TamB
VSSSTPAAETPQAPQPARHKHGVLRALAWIAISFVILLIVLVVGVTWYTKTEDFQRRVNAQVVNVLEDSVGGQVELGHISFDLWHLAIEADALVIHGTEGPGEAPYLSAAKIFVRLKINTFLSHTMGKGAQSRIGLNFLRVEQPHVHLIVDKDGKTNQPTPKRPTPSTEPVQDAVLDLKAGEVELADGLAVVNDRAVPFDMAANQLNVEIHYIRSTDRYGATIDLADLQTKIAKEPQVQSKLHMTAQLGRDMFELSSLDFDTGAATHLSANALITHFAKPEWEASINGAVELKQLGYLAGIDGFTQGNLELKVNGRNCEVTPQAAQKKHFWQRRNKKGVAPQEKMLPPSPDCKSGYLLVGNVRLRNAGYTIPAVRVAGVDAAAQLHVTPTELLFTALTGTLPGGGTVVGELKIENWLGEVPSNAPAASATAVAAATTANTAAKGVGAKPPVKSVNMTPVGRAHAFLTVTVNRITLRTIMDITAPEHYHDLGLDTQISGPVNVEWGGPAKDISSSVQVDADLNLTPSGVPRKGAAANIPVTGVVQAHYDGGPEVVNIRKVDVRTLGSLLTASGVLGVNDGDPLTSLVVNLESRNLGEFDQTLQTIGFENDGKKGTAAIPVVLHGQMSFVGTAKGEARDLDVKGHLAANDLEVKLGTEADVHIDSVVTDAEYSPNAGLAVASSTIKRGTAVLTASGTARPHKLVSRRGVVTYVWDNDLAVNATAKLANAEATDLLDIAGQKDKVDLTGAANINAHVAGTLADLTGAVDVSLKNGEAYGERYQTIAADATLNGPQINATRLLVQAHDMAVNGSGSYNITTKHIAGQLAGSNLRLSKLDLVQKEEPDADGVLMFRADANGTLEQPNLHANLEVKDITFEGKPIGQVNATAHSSGSDVLYDVRSTLIGAQVAANGQTSLVGDFETQARLTIANVDVARVMSEFSTSTLKVNSVISGTIAVAGPVARPKQLAGTAVLDTLNVTAQGIELKSAEPVRASLRGGVVTLDSMHITGDDTDMRAGGTAQVFGDTNPQGGRLHLTANGSVNLGLAHTFNPDLITSGHLTFKMGVEGRMKQPEMTGTVAFQNANLAIDGVPNGLSNLNGTMVFNQNRLEVKDVKGVSGGGTISMGGFVSYQKGLYADLTASADNVRVRLYGLSASANAKLEMQGGPSSLLLSGNVLITRFGIGPDVDFAAFAGAGGIPAAPDPNAISNKVRMDVRVTSAPQLDFQNSYAKLAGTVDLRVQGTIAQPSILGTIRVTDGSATFAGTKYQLDRGTIYFSNPVRIDPIIDLDVSTRVENYDVTIGLHGTSTSLKPTYRSEPPLTEADIFNLLTLGRTQEEAQINSQQQEQAGTDPMTSALLGGALNATVSSRVNKLFGAGSVKIDPAFVGTLGNSTARITVQEPLSKQLTLVYATNVNETAQQLIQLQYQINENTSLVMTRDESGVFSIVYKIRKRYR